MGKQLEQAARDMENKTTALTKIMPNTRAPIWLARQLLCSVADSVGLYEAPLGRREGETGKRDRQIKSLHVRGMDALCEVVDIERRPYFGMGSPRPAPFDTQVVTITLNKADADVLLNRRHVLIGMDHHARDCKSPMDRSRCCFKSRKGGHSLAECKGSKRCPLRKEKHRAGSGECKAFRNQLAS
ncbi:hypothetical protein HHI36_016986 [Cryptolaemus montrouzieri]|uniref:Uncharacterized protein n=1 Tax=Cryptolaemus montrouzieri TaxID=559131 RepID=A0ABD2NMA8_9CUCU